MRTARFIFLAGLVWGLSACADRDPSVTVRVVTGLVPGAEFRTVHTSVFDGSREVASSDAVARLGSDYALGNAVAAFQLHPQQHAIRVRLMRPDGSFLVERTVLANISSDTVVSIHITRDCVGVICPGAGASALESTCLAGRCVDPRCSSAQPSYCPAVHFCVEPNECAALASCAEPLCDEGVCTPRARAGACSETEWCNPDTGAGCEPIDATNARSNPACGTICTDPSEPCRFGYVRCPDAEASFCEPLGSRPVGSACGVARICDVVGECVPVGADTPGFVVSPTSGLVTNEDRAFATFTMALRTAPTADVIVNLASSDFTEGGVTPSSLTFTPLNWNAAHAVTITGVNDGERDGTVDYSVVTSPALSSDANYNGMDPPDVAVSNSDNDSPGVALSRTVGLITSEAGGSDTFTVVLLAAPTATSSISFTSDAPDEATPSPSTVTFNTINWASPQTISVIGNDDAARDGDAPFTILSSSIASSDAAYAGMEVPDVTGVNIDDESAGIRVNPVSGLVTSEAGASATFTIVLQSEPSADVTVPLANSDPSEGSLSVASVTFTPTDWDSPRTVRMTGVDDAIADGDQPFFATLGPAGSADADYNGMEGSDVQFTNTDNETAGFVLSRSSGLVTSELGSTDTFTISLRSQPSGDVHFDVASTNSLEGTVSPSVLTFTSSDWNVSQLLTLTGVNDFVADGNRAYQAIVHVSSSVDSAYAGLSDQHVDATNTDNESAGITVIPTAGLVTTEAGGAATFSVVLTSQPTGNVTIGLSSSAAQEGLPTPNTLTFTASDWATPQTVTVTGVDDSVIDGDIAYTIVTGTAASTDDAYNGQNASDVSVTNTNDDLPPYTEQTHTLVMGPPPLGGFGNRIVLSADGNTLALAAIYDSSSATGINGAHDNTASGSGAVYIYVQSGSVWTQQAFIKASNTDASDQFGWGLDLSPDGNTLVVGAPSERSNATGINGNQADNSNGYSGAAYAFVRVGTTWTQQAYIKASNSQNSDSFGGSVALSADGNTCAIAAPNEGSNATGINGNEANNAAVGAGAVYLFSRSGAVWTQQAYIKASNTETNDRFAYDLDLSSDGNTLAVSASNEPSGSAGVGANQLDNSMSLAGAVYVFTRTASVWSQQVYIKASNPDAVDQFGTNLVLASSGDVLLVAARGEDSDATGINGNQASNARTLSGAVYLFRRVASAWTQEAYVKASNPDANDLFGWALALSGDGDTVVVGVPSEDSNATTVNGNQADNSAMDSGAAYVFRRVAGTWSQLAYIKPSLNGGGFGNTVESSFDGSLVIIGGGYTSGAGSIFAFARTL